MFPALVDKSSTVIVVLTHTVVLQVPSARTKYVVVINGFTASVGPELIKVPPQEVAYQFQLAPAPKLPPATDNMLRSPGQTVEGELIAAAGAAERFSTRIVILTQLVVLQVPSALTKYVVVDEGLTIIELPFPIAAPAPQPPEYQYQSAPVPRNPPEIVKVVGRPAQTVGLEAFKLEASLELVFTLMVKAATAEVSQPSALTK